MQCAVCCQEIGHQFPRHREAGLIVTSFLLGLRLNGSQRGVPKLPYLSRFDRWGLQMLIGMLPAQARKVLRTASLKVSGYKVIDRRKS